jgi:hypothetical protein
VNRLDITHLSFGALAAVTATALFLVLSGTRSVGGAAVAAALGIALGTATTVFAARHGAAGRAPVPVPRRAPRPGRRG